jgi:prepilin-type N-terminal cleavage/methylation domain-containing protein
MPTDGTRHRPNAPTQRRSAFTLLEVVLAVAIGVLLMSALYMAMNIQVRHAQSGREVVAKGNLVRAILARFTDDISSSLGTINLSSNIASGSSASSNPSSSTPSTPATNQGTTGGTANATGNAGGAGAAPAQAASNSGSSSVQFNLGVQGDNNTLVLYVSRWPREATAAARYGNLDPTISLGISDLRRITYWMVAPNGGPGGLARQEIIPVTSDDLMSAVPPDIPDEATYVKAEEVRNLRFTYFDGNTWQDTWDGTALGPDGVTPVGPPAAIAIEVMIAPHGEPSRTYRHVVAIQAANGLAPPNPNPSNANSSNSGSGS